MRDRVVIGTCLSCKKILTLELPISYNLICESCSTYLHSCIQCKHFDIQQNNCSSLTAEPTKDPSVKNFCDEYSFSLSKSRGDLKPKKENDTLQKLEGLFKKTEKEEKDSKPKKSINDLFKN